VPVSCPTARSAEQDHADDRHRAQWVAPRQAFTGTADEKRIHADIAAVGAGTFRRKSRCLGGLF
jgi:hypothetical protein